MLPSRQEMKAWVLPSRQNSGRASGYMLQAARGNKSPDTKEPPLIE